MQTIAGAWAGGLAGRCVTDRLLAQVGGAFTLVCKPMLGQTLAALQEGTLKTGC
jgi:hypothetical protein